MKNVIDLKLKLTIVSEVVSELTVNSVENKISNLSSNSGWEIADVFTLHFNLHNKK